MAQRKLHPLYSRESQRRDLLDPEWRQRWYSKPRAISLWRNEFQVRSVMTASVRWHIMNIHSISCIQWIFLVPDTGFPPVTPALQGRYSEWAELIRLMNAFGGDRTRKGVDIPSRSLVYRVCQIAPRMLDKYLLLEVNLYVYILYIWLYKKEVLLYVAL